MSLTVGDFYGVTDSGNVMYPDYEILPSNIHLSFY